MLQWLVRLRTHDIDLLKRGNVLPVRAEPQFAEAISGSERPTAFRYVNQQQLPLRSLIKRLRNAAFERACSRLFTAPSLCPLAHGNLCRTYLDRHLIGLLSFGQDWTDELLIVHPHDRRSLS